MKGGVGKIFQCYPSFRTIGKAVGLSRNTVRKYVSNLESKGLIETEKTFVFRKDGSKWNGNFKFTIPPIQSALNFYNESQVQNAQNHPQEALGAVLFSRWGKETAEQVKRQI